MLKLTQTLVAPQGSWRWQQRLRNVTYTPVIRKRDGRLVWGNPREGRHFSGGNLRSEVRNYGEVSRYRDALTPVELWCSAVDATIQDQ